MPRCPDNLIAVTGGMGTGKSSVSTYWASLSGVPLINVDRICAELLEKENAGWLALKNEFGDFFLLGNGHLDRRKLRNEIFADTEMRHRINALIHPLAQERTFADVSRCAAHTVIVDVPLLFEAGWEDRFNYRVVVFADNDQSCKRIARRDKVEQADAVRALLTQMPLCEKVMRADHVINNSGCWAATILEIMHLSRLIFGKKNKDSHL